MIRHAAGIAEIVDDVNAAVAFYRDTLGLEVTSQDGDDYAMLAVPGVLHFGIWNRAHAAECLYGSRDEAGKVPLGFTLEFEVDAASDAASDIEGHGGKLVQAPREEPWGQKSFRMLSPGGSVLGFAETPWARRIIETMKVTPDSDGE